VAGKQPTVKRVWPPMSVFAVVAQIAVTRGGGCPGPELRSLLMTWPSLAPPQVYELLPVSLIFLCCRFLFMLVFNVLVTLSDYCLMNIHV
jgi:hypothetical protein